MAYPVQRITPTRAGEGASVDAADHALLMGRIAAGLAHEGKNPLHNMVLHVQLMAEKLAAAPGAPVERHLQAVRDGIGRVDGLLRAFGEFANPSHLTPDLGAAVARTIQLFQYDARRAGVHVTSAAPQPLPVQAASEVLGDLVAHAYLAALELSRDGGNLELRVESTGPYVVLEVVGAGGNGSREAARPHLDAMRRLAPLAPAELSIETPPAGGGRLSLSFTLPR